MIEPAQPAFGFMADIHGAFLETPISGLFAGFTNGRELSMSERIFVGISAVVAACNDFVTGYNYAAYRHFIECVCFFCLLDRKSVV